MATFCHNVQEWVEENVEKPVESWVNQQEQRCRNEPCNWWMLCLNKLICWLVWVTVKVVTWVVVSIGKWITRVVCEVVNFVLDVVAFVVNLIMAIPIIGGIIRTIVNWVSEIIWRAIGLIDLGLGAIGIRPEKKIHVSLLIPRSNGVPVTTEAAMMPHIKKATEIYKRTCNVKIVYRGACTAPDAPNEALNVGCDGSGFFSDWWVGGSYIQYASSTCEFSDGWRRLTGYGGDIIIIPILNVLPDGATSSTVGCSFASTHDYVVVEAASGASVSAHEMGHACWLAHVSDDATNLMWPSNLVADPVLTSGQVALVRWSKHCVYF